MRLSSSSFVLALLACIAVPLGSCAQYTIGVSAGGMYFQLRSQGDGGHARSSFDPATGPFWTLSAHYRELRYPHTNLGLELIYTRKEFKASYSNGGLAGSYGASGFVELDLLHAAIVPQVFLNATKRSCIRFGLMNGIKLRSRINGVQYHHVAWTHWDRALVDAPAEAFGGDLRLVLGLGQVFQLGPQLRLTFDPYYSPAIGSLFKDRPRAVGMEAGLRVGLALERNGHGITGLMDRIPVPNDPGY